MPSSATVSILRAAFHLSDLTPSLRRPSEASVFIILLLRSRLSHVTPTVTCTQNGSRSLRGVLLEPTLRDLSPESLQRHLPRSCSLAWLRTHRLTVPTSRPAPPASGPLHWPVPLSGTLLRLPPKPPLSLCSNVICSGGPL